MIIKTTRYRNKRFKELLNYISSDKGRVDQSDSFSIYHNLRSTDKDEIITEFERNDQYRKARKRGVVIYHEILSFHIDENKGNLNLEVLEDLTRQFIDLRAPKALCYAKPHLHFKNDNIHIHVMISGNELNSTKTLRIDNKTFVNIRKDMEKYQMDKYPKLTNSICYLNKWEKDKALEEEKLKTKDSEFQLKKRTGKQSDKEKISQIIKVCYDQSESKDDFFKQIVKQGFEIYKYRNRINGIKDKSGKKYRFKTLAISQKQIELLERNYNRLSELQNISDRKEKNKERSETQNRHF